MKRIMPRMIGLILVLLIGVFVGIEWTQSGIERVYGPLDGAAAQPVYEQPIQSKPLASAPMLSVEEISKTEGPEEIWIDIDRKQVRYVPADTVNDTRDPVYKERESSRKDAKDVLSLQAPADNAPINQIANQTAGLLQQLSEAGIKAVVGLFGSIF